MNDGLTEWDMMKWTLYGRQAEAGQHKYEPHIINYILFIVYFIAISAYVTSEMQPG